MKTLPASLATLCALLLAAPAAFACADESGCRNRPGATADVETKPQTRALKKKPKKDCADGKICKQPPR